MTHQVLDAWLRPSYDEAFECAADRAAERLTRLTEESRSTDDLAAELLREPTSGRRRIANEERFHSLKLCQILQSRSRETWLSDPAAAVEMADLAVEVSRHLETGRYGSSLVEDSRALAWAYLGNAFRITSDLWRAEQALHQAWHHHEMAGQDAYTETEILKFTSSLRNDQGRYNEAVQLTDRAITIYREGQDRHLEGSALILKALILGDQGRTQEAIPLLHAGLDRIDSEKDPRLVFVGKHNIIVLITHSGDLGKAQQLIKQSRSPYQDLGQIDLAKIHWLEGFIAGSLGQLDEAETALCEARDFYLDCQLGIEFFLSSLDLAKMYRLAGRSRQVKEILGEVIPLGEALGLRQETLLARLLYEQASH